MSLRKIRFLAAALTLRGALLAAQEHPAAPPIKLNLVIVAGEGTRNKIRIRSTSDTIVQVEDENHQPVAGATVVFLLPASGPGGTFLTGSKAAIAATDASGRSVMPRIRLNSTAGKYEIKVHASHHGLEANASVSETSLPGPAVSAGVVICIVAAVAAGAGTAIVTSRGKGNSSTSSPPVPPPIPSGSIGGAAGVSIGPPH